ncbi:MAG: hypothetical protein AAF411_08900 [Myxococcota bacterium]
MSEAAPAALATRGAVLAALLPSLILLSASFMSSDASEPCTTLVVVPFLACVFFFTTLLAGRATLERGRLVASMTMLAVYGVTWFALGAGWTVWAYGASAVCR